MGAATAIAAGRLDESVQLGVRAAGQNKEFELSMEGRTYEDLKWEEQTWEFTAKEKTTVIDLLNSPWRESCPDHWQLRRPAHSLPPRRAAVSPTRRTW